MLTLKRRTGQEIVIGEGAAQIRIRIDGVRHFLGHPEVTVSIAAPPDALILRKELVGRAPKPKKPEDEFSAGIPT